MTTTNVQKAVAKAVTGKFAPDATINRIINLANHDLYFGPIQYDPIEEDEDFDFCQSEGIATASGEFDFSAACKRISDYADDLPSTLYYDYDADLLFESEPEGELVDTGEVNEDGEPVMEYFEPESYYIVEYREIRRILLGEVAQYL